MSGRISSTPIFSTKVPLIGLAVAAAILLTAPIARPDWSVVPRAARGALFLLALVSAASMMPVKSLPAPSWETALGLGFVSAVFDNIPLTALAIEQEQTMTGVSCLHRRFWWFHDLVRVVGRRAVVGLDAEARSTLRWLKGGWPWAAGLCRRILHFSCSHCSAGTRASRTTSRERNIVCGGSEPDRASCLTGTGESQVETPKTAENMPTACSR